jgi:TonB family protein
MVVTQRSKQAMRALLLIATVAGLAFSGHCFAGEIPKFDQSMLLSGNSRKEQRPDYPYEARNASMQGSGVFILNINEKTGVIESIRIKKSTGYRILDLAAMKAFITYRFKPHTPTKVWIPVSFLMSPS